MQVLKDAALAAIRDDLGADASAVELHQRVLEVLIADVLDTRSLLTSTRDALSDEQLAHRQTRDALIGVIGRLRYYTRHNALLRKLGNEYDAIERRQQEKAKPEETSAGVGGDVALHAVHRLSVDQVERDVTDEQESADNEPKLDQ